MWRAADTALSDRGTISFPSLRQERFSMMLTRVRTVLILAGALVTGSCAADGATGVAEAQFSTSGGADLAQIAQYRDGAPQITVAWAMAWIGPEGGSVRILDFEIVVPAGAVSSRTRFGIRLPVDPWQSKHAVAEFTPHNVTFAVPVTLRLPYSGTTAEGTASRVLWWSGSDWVPFDTEVVDGRLETTTSHFSLYGTEEPSRGITPLGG
jgi:hypothetical protein